MRQRVAEPLTGITPTWCRSLEGGSVDTPADMLQGTQSPHQSLLSLDIVLKNLLSGPLEQIEQHRQEEDSLVNKLRTPGLLCEENLHCTHVPSCE